MPGPGRSRGIHHFEWRIYVKAALEASEHGGRRRDVAALDALAQLLGQMTSALNPLKGERLEKFRLDFEDDTLEAITGRRASQRQLDRP